MTSAERQRLHRRRKKALAKQREVTIVTGAGRIAQYQVERATPERRMLTVIVLPAREAPRDLHGCISRGDKQPSKARA